MAITLSPKALLVFWGTATLAIRRISPERPLRDKMERRESQYETGIQAFPSSPL